MYPRPDAEQALTSICIEVHRSRSSDQCSSHFTRMVQIDSVYLRTVSGRKPSRTPTVLLLYGNLLSTRHVKPLGHPGPKHCAAKSMQFRLHSKFIVRALHF